MPSKIHNVGSQARQVRRLDHTLSHIQEVWVFLYSTHHFWPFTASLPLLHAYSANAVHTGDAVRKYGCVCVPPATSSCLKCHFHLGLTALQSLPDPTIVRAHTRMRTHLWSYYPNISPSSSPAGDCCGADPYIYVIVELYWGSLPGFC